MREKVIFVGVVTDVDKYIGWATFDVLESFTTTPPEGPGTIVRPAHTREGRFQFKFVIGKRYLVYAHVVNHFVVFPCSGTRQADEAAAEIAYVRDWSRQHAYTRNSLSGRLTDATGKPVSWHLVELVQVNTDNHELRLALTDDSGEFRFTKIPPGEYVLGFNMPGLSYNYAPRNPTEYFPGVRDRNAAVLVRFYGGERLYGFDFSTIDPDPPFLCGGVRVEGKVDK